MFEFCGNRTKEKQKSDRQKDPHDEKTRIRPSSAADMSGECGKVGDNLTWTCSGGVLTISGEGEMADYENQRTSRGTMCPPGSPKSNSRSA